jgi:hypothetical protein
MRKPRNSFYISFASAIAEEIISAHATTNMLKWAGKVEQIDRLSKRIINILSEHNTKFDPIRFNNEINAKVTALRAEKAS